jgi:hypothetical protein
MAKLIILGPVALGVLSVWIGLQIKDRDPLWWIFVYPAPLACAAVVGCYWLFKGKKGDRD